LKILRPGKAQIGAVVLLVIRPPACRVTPLSSAATDEEYAGRRSPSLTKSAFALHPTHGASFRRRDHDERMRVRRSLQAISGHGDPLRFGLSGRDASDAVNDRASQRRPD
jgi:hypothetical protein